MATGPPSDRENRGYPARADIATCRANGIITHDMAGLGSGVRNVALVVSYSPYNRTYLAFE